MPAIALKDRLTPLALDGSETGALKKASILLLVARARRDVVDSQTSIQFGSGALQLHHIYPKDWCANNSSGTLANVLDKKSSKYDFINSPANLMPMSRNSNLLWRKKAPAHFIEESEITFDMNADLWSAYFIPKELFGLLSSPVPNPEAFWLGRGELIASEIYRRMTV
ncbi:MAG: hypothetical protein ABIU10_00635 [Sphingomicrobium sp.]